MRLGRGGTGTHRPLDSAALAKVVERAGIDPRHWSSYGTVCTLNDDGSFNFDDPLSVYTSPDGCHVDVLIHPVLQHVTCRYSGVQGGSAGTIYTPIQPGDEVLVIIPDGDLRQAPVITRILSAEHSRLPMGPDRKPLWQNDRILIHGNTVPVEIRTAGGGHILVAMDGTVTVNDGTKGAARLDDTTKLTMSPADIAALATLQLLATGVFMPSGSSPTAASPIEFDGGQITSASATVKVGD